VLFTDLQNDNTHCVMKGHGTHCTRAGMALVAVVIQFVSAMLVLYALPGLLH
jgi:hypothetical protein